LINFVFDHHNIKNPSKSLGGKIIQSLKKNKAIIVFLVKFFATYFILFGAYSFYLNKTQQKGDF